MKKCEVITMPMEERLSDADLQALLMGVIKLVKKYASTEQIERLKKTIDVGLFLNDL